MSELTDTTEERMTLNEPLTLGSLFSGLGSFELAGLRAGIRPVWASEIEPFPIRVTSKRFPDMQHLGNIHDLRGDEIDPVDIVTSGSPCQNLSAAATKTRTGLHGEQSSLFFEAVRIIREMREKTNGQPRWIAWENVQNALHCSGGEAFREVLESFVRIKDPTAVVPMPEKGGWLPAGEIRGSASEMGDNYSLAWRVLDASAGWGVAQRRKRLFVVLDLDGERAGQILFESEGLSGYTPPCGAQGQAAAAGAENGAGAASGYAAVGFEPGLLRRKGDHHWKEVCSTLRADMGDNQAAVAYGISSDQSFAMLSANPSAGIYEASTSRTLDCSGTNPSANQGGIVIVEPAPAYCMTVGGFAQVCEEASTTLEARGFKDPPVVGYPVAQEYIARRLTPDECALLMGYPLDWCHDLETENPTDAEIAWWQEVFETHRKAMGKSTKPRSVNQIRKWLQNPRSDGAEYKAYGNSIVVQCAHFVLAGIVWAHQQEGVMTNEND